MSEIIHIEGGYVARLDENVPDGFCAMYVNDELIFIGPMPCLQKPISNCTLAMNRKDFDKLKAFIKRNTN